MTLHTSSEIEELNYSTMIDGASLLGHRLCVLKKYTYICYEYASLVRHFFLDINKKNSRLNLFIVFLKTWFAKRKIEITLATLELCPIFFFILKFSIRANFSSDGFLIYSS